MPISEADNKATALRLAPYPPERKPHEYVLPRLRFGSGVLANVGGGGVLMPPHPGGGGGILLPPLVPPSSPGGGVAGVVEGQSPTGPYSPLPPGGVPPEPPVQGGGGFWQNLDPNRLFGYPIQFALSAVTATVQGSQLGPFNGPAIIRDVHFEMSGTTGGSEAGNVIRVDFSSVSGTDVFTRVAGDLPTGTSSAQQTLWQNVSSWFGGTLHEGGRAGWVNFNGAPSGAGFNMTWQNVNYLITLSSFYIKCYIQNNTASTEQATLHMTLCPLTPAQVGTLPSFPPYDPGPLGL